MEQDITIYRVPLLTDLGECIIALGCRQRLHVKAISDRFGGGGNDRPIMPDPALNRAKTRGASVET